MFWFLYTKWSDIMVFHYAYGSYLLQGRKNKLTRATHFRIAGLNNCGSSAAVYDGKDSQLKDAGLWEQDRLRG